MYEVTGAQWCPHCQNAKQLLEDRGLGYVFKDIDLDPESGVKLLEEGLKTIPQVWHDGKHIGGFTDLVEYFKTKGE